MLVVLIDCVSAVTVSLLLWFIDLLTSFLDVLQAAAAPGPNSWISSTEGYPSCYVYF